MYNYHTDIYPQTTIFNLYLNLYLHTGEYFFVLGNSLDFLPIYTARNDETFYSVASLTDSYRQNMHDMSYPMQSGQKDAENALTLTDLSNLNPLRSELKGQFQSNPLQSELKGQFKGKFSFTIVKYKN